MNVIVHYPSDKQGLDELQRKISVEHAKQVINYISSLNCTETEKLELLNEISR